MIRSKTKLSFENFIHSEYNLKISLLYNSTVNKHRVLFTNLFYNQEVKLENNLINLIGNYFSWYNKKNKAHLNN